MRHGPRGGAAPLPATTVAIERDSEAIVVGIAGHGLAVGPWHGSFIGSAAWRRVDERYVRAGISALT